LSVATTRGLFFVDSHWGYEIKAGKKRPLHDPKAHEILLQIAHDWRPNVVIMGGDGLDCGAASHWNSNKPRLTEGLRLEKDAEDYRAVLTGLACLDPKEKHYIMGNHEDWVTQFVDANPAVEGLVSIEQMLHLEEDGWQVHPQGSVINVGKLYFMHGDTVRSSTYPARYAVDTYGRSICFGHFHSPQSYTKVSALDSSDVHTGRSVGCLCRKDPGYGRGSPNRWAQGFLLFERAHDGFFQTYEINITEGKAIWNGRRYRG
jgi:predicted phosphodiesterase